MSKSNLSEDQLAVANGHSLARIATALPVGAKFRITDYEYVQSEETYTGRDGKTHHYVNPVFKTNFGECVLNVKDAIMTFSIVPFENEQKERITSWSAVGDFHDDLRKFNRSLNGNDDERLIKMVEHYKETNLKVVSVTYIQCPKRAGGSYSKMFVNIEFDN